MQLENERVSEVDLLAQLYQEYLIYMEFHQRPYSYDTHLQWLDHIQELFNDWQAKPRYEYECEHEAAS
jgi:hypothetical protein